MHDSDEPQYIGTRRRGSFQARAFQNNFRLHSVSAARHTGHPQSPYEEKQAQPGPSSNEITYIIQTIPLDGANVEWSLSMGIRQDVYRCHLCFDKGRQILRYITLSWNTASLATCFKTEPESHELVVVLSVSPRD